MKSLTSIFSVMTAGLILIFAAQAGATPVKFTISSENGKADALQASTLVNGLANGGIIGQIDHEIGGTVLKTAMLTCQGVSNAATSQFSCTNDLAIERLQGESARVLLGLILARGGGTGSLFARSLAKVDSIDCVITGYNGQTVTCEIEAR